MRRGTVIAALLALGLAAGAALAEEQPPRDIWAQATSAARDGDVDMAFAKTNELIATGKQLGLKTYPVYSASAAGIAWEASREAKPEVETWATRAAGQLDPKSSALEFLMADRAARAQSWGRAAAMTGRGFSHLLGRYRTRALSFADLAILICTAIAATTVIFALALYIRYGRAMAHDFREVLGTRITGGSVSVLAFALTFLPIFLWLGPIWLLFYWLAIFFGYANKTEKAFIVILALALAVVPLVLDYNAHRIAVTDSPVVAAAIASQEQSYQPDALRRLQEVATTVPDNDTLHILLGNLQAFEGNEPQAAEHYRRALQIRETAGARVNIGNLHFLQNDYPAALTEYSRAEKLDPKLAIAVYNQSVASGETYKFNVQGEKLEQARRIDSAVVEALQNQPPDQMKIAMYHPPIEEAIRVATAIARRGAARSLFGTYSWFDPANSLLNPVTLGSVLAVLLGVALWAWRRRTGFAGSCMKCGRTFCYRCKSARESATYCTQCIHIYLKRDGVSLATKRAKLEDVSDHISGIHLRNRIFTTLLPGSAQVLEGRTVAGMIGILLFTFFVSAAILTGRLAPAIGPVADTAQMTLRVIAIALALAVWFTMSLPVYFRRTAA